MQERERGSTVNDWHAAHLRQIEAEDQMRPAADFVHVRPAYHARLHRRLLPSDLFLAANHQHTHRLLRRVDLQPRQVQHNHALRPVLAQGQPVFRIVAHQVLEIFVVNLKRAAIRAVRFASLQDAIGVTMGLQTAVDGIAGDSSGGAVVW